MPALRPVIVSLVALALALTGCTLRQDGEPASPRPVGPSPSTLATGGVTPTSGTTPPRADRRPAGLPGMPCMARRPLCRVGAGAKALAWKSKMTSWPSLALPSR